jgi:hypothetical protein
MKLSCVKQLILHRQTTNIRRNQHNTLTMLVQPLQQGAHAAGGESDVRIRRTVIQMDRVAFGLADIFAEVRALTQQVNS